MAIQQSDFARLRRPGQLKTLLDAHRRRELQKWSRYSKPDERTAVLDGLEANNTALLPFTIDHLGGIGQQAHDFLFSPKLSPFPRPPPLPPEDKFYARAPSPAVIRRAKQIHINLLTKATQQWSSPFYNNRSIGSTYHSQSPSQWALQMLSINFCNSFATHFLQAQRRCASEPLLTAASPKVVTAGRQSFQSPTGGREFMSRLAVVLV